MHLYGPLWLAMLLTAGDREAELWSIADLNATLPQTSSCGSMTETACHQP